MDACSFEKEIRSGGSPHLLNRVIASVYAVFESLAYRYPFTIVVQDRMEFAVTKMRRKSGWRFSSCLCLAATLLHGQSSLTHDTSNEPPAADDHIATQEMERQFQDAMTAQDKGDLEHAKSLLL